MTDWHGTWIGRRPFLGAAIAGALTLAAGQAGAQDLDKVTLRTN